MTTSALLEALEEVSNWRQEREGFFDGKENEFSLRERKIQEQMTELNSKLATVQAEREESRQQRAKVAPEEQRRAHQALMVGLGQDSERISQRSVGYQEVVEEREQRVQKLLETPALSRKVQEFEQFHETQAQFENLPESYRSVILKHHDEVRAELQPIFNAFAEPLRIIDAEEERVGIVATIEPSDATPEALALVLPIPFQVYTDLTNVQESLEHLVAYRCAGLVSGMLLRVGVPSAPVLFDEYKGLIMIRVYLSDHDVVGDIRKALQLELERVEKRSSEMKATNLKIEVAWVESDVLMGEE